MAEVIRQRGATYADIADNSRVFTGIMKALGVTLPEGMSDVDFHCLAMKATKMARYATGDRKHEDTFIDDANYSVLIAAHNRREAGKTQPYVFIQDSAGTSMDTDGARLVPRGGKMQ